MAIFQISSCFLISFIPLNFFTLAVLTFFGNFSVAFIDSIGEGLSGKISKEKIELKKMKENFLKLGGKFGENEDILKEKKDNNMGVFGKLISLNKIFFKLSIFLGGLVAEKVSIRVIYAVEAIYPTLLLFFIIFYFKEKKVIYFIIKKKSLIIGKLERSVSEIIQNSKN